MERQGDPRPATLRERREQDPDLDPLDAAGVVDQAVGVLPLGAGAPDHLLGHLEDRGLAAELELDRGQGQAEQLVAGERHFLPEVLRDRPGIDPLVTDETSGERERFGVGVGVAERAGVGDERGVDRGRRGGPDRPPELGRQPCDQDAHRGRGRIAEIEIAERPRRQG